MNLSESKQIPSSFLKERIEELHCLLSKYIIMHNLWVRFNGSAEKEPHIDEYISPMLRDELYNLEEVYNEWLDDVFKIATFVREDAIVKYVEYYCIEMFSGELELPSWVVIDLEATAKKFVKNCSQVTLYENLYYVIFN